MKYTADFETTTDFFDCRVWAWAIHGIEENLFTTGNNIESFMDFWKKDKHNNCVYFHNLKFDGSFILSWLLNNGYSFIKDARFPESSTFSTLITDTGQFYTIKVFFKVNGKRKHCVTFIDSLKIFPNFSVEKVAEGFGLPLKKLELDYTTKRKKGHELTTHEIDYIHNDVAIMAEALKQMFNQNLNKMTIASDAMKSFTEFTPAWRDFFPLLSKEDDNEIRMSYKGGFTYLNDIYEKAHVGTGLTLDVNSLYPAMMKKPMPYGIPEKFQGKYKYDPEKPLYVQKFICTFHLRPQKIPTIQLKHTMSFMPNEYVKSTDMPEVLTLTSIDLKLFFEQYDVEVYEWCGGYKFQKAQGLFDPYIDYWTKEKINAGKENNKPKRQIAKLMLNSLYGRFGLNPISQQKMPYLDEDGVVRFTLMKEEERESVYIPVASFITSYGRDKTIRTSQAVRDYSLKHYGKDKYIYSDTDSIHALLNEKDLEHLSDIIEIDDYKLGCWAHESNFEEGLFIRQKCYIERIDGKINVTVAGLPKYLSCLINFENFRQGFTTEGMSHDDMVKLARKNGATDEEIKKLHNKLTYKYVKGGVVLTDTDFTIK